MYFLFQIIKNPQCYIVQIFGLEKREEYFKNGSLNSVAKNKFYLFLHLWMYINIKTAIP